MQELLYLSPLIIISIFSILVLVVDGLARRSPNPVYYFAILALVLTGASAIWTLTMPLPLTAGSQIFKYAILFSKDRALFDIIFSAAGLLTVFSAREYLRREYSEFREFYTLILFAVTGMTLIAHAGNFIIIFLGVELMSIVFYVLAGFVRTREWSVEASLKYFVLGSFSTGFLLYGMALVFGATGAIDFYSINAALREGLFNQSYFKVGMGLILIGLMFKAAAFPFHQWAPDVYTGAPTVVAGFMSTAGKSAALIGFMVIAREAIPHDYGVQSVTDALNTVNAMWKDIRDIIAWISAATMIVGNITALAQKNIKRMLAYSSIAHAGYMLIGLAADNGSGYGAIAFYSLAYVFMQLGSFTALSIFERDYGKNLELKDFAGLSKRKPWLAALMAVFMFSLVGLPPFAGFFGKYYLFLAAIETGYTWLAIVGVIASIISIYYYIGVIVYMYFREPSEAEFAIPAGRGAGAAVTLSAVGLIVFGLLPFLFMDYALAYFR